VLHYRHGLEVEDEGNLKDFFIISIFIEVLWYVIRFFIVRVLFTKDMMSTRPCTSQSLLKDAYDRGNGTPHHRRLVDLSFEKEIERKFHSTDEDIEVTVFIKRDSLNAE
jgi:hypothetical protein